MLLPRAGDLYIESYGFCDGIFLLISANVRPDGISTRWIVLTDLALPTIKAFYPTDTLSKLNSDPNFVRGSCVQ